MPLDDAVVRLKVKASAEQIRRVEFSAIRKLADDAGVHKFVIAPPDVIREDRARVEGLTDSLSVPEALDLYLASADPPVASRRAEQLRALTAELLEGVGA
jgi:hypothetical protein